MRGRIRTFLAFASGAVVVLFGQPAVADDAGAPASNLPPEALPAVTSDAGVPTTDGAPEGQPLATPAQSTGAENPTTEPPLPPVEEEVVSVLAGVKDIAELSLEDLLNAELTTSTKSKPMSIRDSPNVMTLVTREEIQRSGARELADVLRLVPGFTLNGDLYGSVYAGIRGVWGSEGKILVLLDGHEMFDLLYYDTELGNRVPVDQIDRIEIVRGPGSVVYGGAAELAVINIITRSAEDLEGASVTGIYGQMFDGAAREGQSLSQTFGHRTLSAAFGKTIGGQRGLSLKAGIYVGQGNRSDQTYTDINGATYNVTGNARTDPMLLHAAAEYRGIKLGYLFEYYRTTMKDGYGEMLADTLPVNYLSSSLIVSYEWKLRQNLKLVPRFHWLFQKPWQTASEAARNYPSIYWNPTAQRVQGGLTLAWGVVRPLNLLLGSDYYVDSATNTYDPFVDPNNPALTTSHVSYWNATVYGEALLDTPWANLSAGARYEHRRLVGGSFVPRAGATKTFGPFHYKLLYSRAFRAPSIGDLARSIDTKPETTTVAEVELGYRIHSTLFAVINGFDITIDKPFLYFFDTTTGLDSYRNYDRMGTRGAEFELRFRSERTFANLSYSYYTAAGKDKIDSMAVAGHGSVLLGFSPHKVALLAGAGITKQLDASLSAILLAGPRFGYYAYDASSGAPLARDYGAEMQLNAFLSYKDLLVPGSLVGIGIYNLANAKTVLIQPYDNGHPPFPGPSREVFLRLGYEVRRQGQGPSAP